MDTPELELAPHPEGKREAEALVSNAALAIAGLWLVGAGATAFALLGTRLTALSFAEAAAAAAAVLAPSMIMLILGFAARDGARARAEARRLAAAADRLLDPERSSEDALRQLASSVRNEIGSLDRAIENTLARLQDVEGQVGRQAHAVNLMAEKAKTGAQHMIVGLEREREDLLTISRELGNQAQAIGDSISRHTHSISEAARGAEAEVRAADQALDHRLTSFGAAAALISDRTQGLSSAAQASADSALRLESALSNALDILSRATALTDTARQSAEAAALAANSTAGAVQDTTEQAVETAKRAAEMIRNEAVAVEQDAAAALERLREAAEAARAAAVEAREALEDERLVERAPPRSRREAPPRDEGHYDASWRNDPDPLETPPPRSRRGARNDANYERPERAPERSQDQGRGGSGGGQWTWRDLLSNVEDGAPSAAPRQSTPRREREREPEDPVAHLRRQISEPRSSNPALPVVHLIEQAGLHLEDVFSPSGLERIAQRARSGTQARRRAVLDAAPDASNRLADFLANEPQANQEAMQFLRNDGARIAELIQRGRASMNAEATRAFLLIDAAAS
jgi:hypothetical protein